MAALGWGSGGEGRRGGCCPHVWGMGWDGGCVLCHGGGGGAAQPPRAAHPSPTAGCTHAPRHGPEHNAHSRAHAAQPPHGTRHRGGGGLPLEGGGPQGTPRIHGCPGPVPPQIFSHHSNSPPQAAKLPMSIIIVGVGQAEFDGEAVLPPQPRGVPAVRGGLIALSPPPLPTAMVELDGDDIRISSRGKVAERDIVQVWDPPALCVGTGRPPPPCSPLPKALGATAGPGVGMGG